MAAYMLQRCKKGVESIIRREEKGEEEAEREMKNEERRTKNEE
jgi:hypothetical protein